MQKKTGASEEGLFARIVHLPQKSGLSHSLTSMNWFYAIGFALCQTWAILCISLPDPITYHTPFLDLRWVSLSTSLVLTVLATRWHDRASGLLHNKRFMIGVGLTASIGSALGPISALFPDFSAPLIYLAAIAVGVGFAGLFLAWFETFCNTRDMIGLAIGVVLTMLFTYPLANMLSSDQMNTWISVAIASALPLVSIFLLRRTPKISGSFISSDETIPHTRKKWVLFRFCLCLFIVVTIIEAVRNLLLSGTALSFYAGVINLGALVLKLGCSAWLLSIFNKHNAAGVSAVYRMAFLLILGVVLCLPFLLEGSWGAHTLLDIGAFFFQLTVIMVAYEISIGFNLSPIIVFGSTRVAWTLGALAGIGIEGLYRAIIGTETIALLSVLLGLAAAIAFVFVFTDKDCVEILSSVPLPVQVPHFKSKCEQLARRSNISDRECEVLILTAKGRSARRIAEDLNVTLATANSHIHHIYQKLGIHSRQELLDLIEIERISH